jgi:hypothetical protein
VREVLQVPPQTLAEEWIAQFARIAEDVLGLSDR